MGGLRTDEIKILTLLVEIGTVVLGSPKDSKK